MPKRLRILNYL